MEFLSQLDTQLLRWIITHLRGPWLDPVMDIASSTQLGVMLCLVGGVAVWLKGGRQGKILLLLLAAGLLTADPIAANPLKKLVGRARPFVTHPELDVRGGRGGKPSFPSSHATNSFLAATLIGFCYRRLRIPAFSAAAIVGLSRVYNGMHYPSDVLAGAVLGTAWAHGVIRALPFLWSNIGRRWFPTIHAENPDLLNPAEPASVGSGSVSTGAAAAAHPDQFWMRAGYAIIFTTCVLRWIYLAMGKIELSEDEAYQWLWSKHLDLSYYSKPLLIAVSHFIGTSLWGDRAFGLRFISPLITAVGSVVLMRFLAREVSARAGFWLVTATTAIPLLCVGAILMTIDPLNVVFWMAAMVSGWKAWRDDSVKHWAWTGLWMGLGFLSKYTALFQWLSWAVFLLLWPQARRCLKSPGPYLALGIQALCTLPVLIWNSRHDWITVTHIEQRGGLDQTWKFTTRFFFDFLLVEPLLLNPVFFVGMVVAAIGIWKRTQRRPLEVYLFSMGVPLFLFYFLYTFRARVQPNWIAPAILPLCAMMVVYWEDRLRQGAAWIPRTAKWAIFPMLVLLVLAHDTNMVVKATGVPLPMKIDPLRRLRGWSETAAAVGEERRRLEKEGGKWFIIGEHYGTTSQISFYLPEAREAVKGEALAYFKSSPIPLNQFFFWPGYKHRKGQNALFVQQVNEKEAAPPSIHEEFESIEDLGVREIQYRGRVIRKVQFFACRNLR